MVTSVKDWVVDSRATKYICSNRSAFTSYTMQRKILLKLTSGKVFVLSDKLHVPDIRWNLVSISLLGKVGVRIIFNYDKIVLTTNNVFVGKGYCNQGFFSYAKCLRNYQ
ncbi:hypothetical protein AAG906_034274 [Vitis piasezkii]